MKFYSALEFMPSIGLDIYFKSLKNIMPTSHHLIRKKVNKVQPIISFERLAYFRTYDSQFLLRKLLQGANRSFGYQKTNL